MSTLQIRVVRPTDYPAMLAIYAPFISDTHTSFEYQVPEVAVFANRFVQYQTQTPCLVLERDGALLGYAYANMHRSRTAYQWSVESSIYLSAEARGQGLGKGLYRALFNCLRYQGFYNVFAGISLPNPASVAVHEAMGFQPIGVYRDIGFKNGRWHDVGWWQLVLQEKTAEPQAPIWLAAVNQQDPAWQKCLKVL